MMESIDVMTMYVIATLTPSAAVINVIMVGSRTGEENKKIITITKRTFLFIKLTTTGMVEQEQNG
jgi:hypothetical protein